MIFRTLNYYSIHSKTENKTVNKITFLIKTRVVNAELVHFHAIPTPGH